jgi:hypothetical protein
MREILRICAYTLWLFAIGTGIVFILNYENASGAAGSTPEHWVSGTSIPLDPKHDTLIMFAHPRCPCTVASVDELNRLLARCDGNISTHVFFFRPKGSPEDWTHTHLRQNVAAIPGVTVQDDVDDVLAQKFGAETSGYVLLYNPQGELLFRGGITGSRGHEGDNAGESSIALLVAGQNASVTQTPVYGCSLVNVTNKSDSLQSRAQ